MLRLHSRYNAFAKLLLLFFAVTFCFAAKAQLSANFRADVFEGCAPLVVKFTDLTTGNPAEWSWNFDNGNTSTQQNPGTIYFSPGNYSVKLVVKNAAGKDSVTKTQYITVHEQPEVDFAISDTTGCIPFTATFTDKSKGVSGTITNWKWDFGDGDTSLERSPSHTYNVKGDFTITFKVTNSRGCSNVLTKASFIRVKQTPTASFTAGSVASCNPPATVNFTNTSTDGPIISTRWDFGDGSSSTTANPSHTYTVPGNYTVILFATNQSGCVDSVSHQTVIGSVKPGFAAPDTVCADAPAIFENTSSPAIFSAFWNFGDGSTSAEISPEKSFSTPGNFTVKLISNFGACKDSVTRRIHVLPKPAADFSFVAPNAGCSLPVNASFTAKTGSVSSYLWNFGDSTVSTARDPSHTYTAFGTYPVSLTVKGANGCTDTVTKPGIISIIPAKINSFNNLPFVGCAPNQITFNPDITSPEPVVSYLWDFGDGTTADIANPAHSYAKAGSYNVTLKIVTSNGCTDSFTLAGAVILTDKPEADFSADPRNACANQLIQFTDISKGNTNNWRWDFGDGGISAVANPLYHYMDTGYFTIRLIVGDLACFDTVTLKNYVHIDPPIAKFTYTSTCDAPLVRRFINKSIGAQTSLWDFGDGNTSSDISPVHTYSSPGTYFIHLHVTHDNCVDDFRDTLVVVDEHPDFTVNNTAFCKNNESVFTITGTDSSNIVSYLWDFGDSTTSVNTYSSGVRHTYMKAGVFSPAVVVTDILGCTRLVERLLSITVFGPVADFTNPPGTCVNAPVIFTDRSKPYANYPVTTWMIDYGDGTTDTTGTPNFTHTYTAPKTYNVSLTVQDSYGCRDTVYKTQAITITDPVASFALTDSISCSNSSISLTNKSSGTGLAYAWKFGDGGTSTAASPVYSYATTGIFTLSLSVKDRYGCVDSAAKENGIVIENAKAVFTVSDSIISCPPAQIDFLSNATYSTSITWDFDDGNFSNIRNPSHYFATARTYYVKLIAKGHGSCADTMIKTISVKGPSGIFSYNSTVRCSPATVNFTASATNNDNHFTWDFGDGVVTSTSTSTISHVYTSIGRFLPKLLLTDESLNCTVSIFGTDTITVSGAESNIKTPRLQFCDSAGIQFSDSVIVQYDKVSSWLWTFGDGATSSAQKPFHYYTAPGIYPVRLTIESVGGCIDSSQTTQIKVVESPAIQLIAPLQICVNEPIVFRGEFVQPDTSSVTWDWSFGNGNTSELQLPPAQVFATAANYMIKATATNSSGCLTADSVRLLVHPLPDVNAGHDSAICLGQSLILSPSGAESYVWQNNPFLSCTNCTSSVALPDASAYFVVTGISAASCRNTDSVLVKVVTPFKMTSIAEDTICKGESLNLPVTGADMYTWTPSAGLSDNHAANPVASPDTTTLYTVTGHDYLHCFSDTAYIPITVFPIPVFNIIDENITMAVGNAATLNTVSSNDVTNWRWSPFTGLSCGTCPNPVATPTTNTTYRAIASNIAGCTAEDQVNITLFCDNGNIFVPNTFSPNNDGMNDVFYPRGKGIAGIKNFKIFNRWGAVVFENANFQVNDPQSGWNGRYNEKDLHSDVFVYTMEIICATGQIIPMKGNVSLIK